MLGSEMTYAVIIVDPGDRVEAVNKACESAYFSEHAGPILDGTYSTYAPQVVTSYLSRVEAEQLLKSLKVLGATAVIKTTSEADELRGVHTVTIVDVGPNRLEVMKAARSISGFQLSQVKEALGNLPAVLVTDCDSSSAAAAAHLLSEAGARVELTGVDELIDAIQGPDGHDSTPAKAQNRFCTNCGEGTTGGNFCGSCGAALSSPSAPGFSGEHNGGVGLDLFHQHLWAESEPHLMVESTSGSLDATLALCVLAQERGDIDTARSHLDVAFTQGLQRFNPNHLDRDPDLSAIDRFWKHGPVNGRGYMYEPLLNLAQSAEAAGLVTTAQHWYLHAIQEGSPEAFISLASLYLDLEMIDQADFWLSEAKAANGDLDEIDNRIADAQVNNDFDAADEWIGRAYQFGDDTLEERIRENEDLRYAYEQDRAPATDNSLGQSLSRLVPDGVLRDLMVQGFGVRNSLNKDEVVGAISVMGKLADYPQGEELLVVTREKLGLFRKGGFLRDAVCDTFTAEEIDSIGIGDSNHYEMAGFVGRGTEFLTLTITTTRGHTHTRHFFLGHTEPDINARLDLAREFLQALNTAGWQIVDGPSYRSTGGYRRTYSYGFGVWF